MNDLFSPAKEYSAKDIEVLEGLEPVRRHPGMYIGGTDEAALHHLVAEVLDNAMDEAVAGQASRIDVVLGPDGSVTVADNGRGIPVDPHPKFKKKSALEVILTTLHSGGKFGGRVYRTAGGPARSGAVGGQRPFRQAPGRGGPRRQALVPALLPRRRGRSLEERGQGGQAPGHHRDLPSGPPRLRHRRPLPPGRGLPHGALQGLSFPRRGNPLGLLLLPPREGGPDAGGGNPALPRGAHRFPGLHPGGTGRLSRPHPSQAKRA